MIVPDVETLRWVADRLETEAREGLRFATKIRRAGGDALRVARVIAAARALNMNARGLRDLADEVVSKQDPHLAEPWPQ